MAKKILIVPVIKKTNDEIFYNVDIQWFKFLNKIFNKPDIEISHKIIAKPDLIILSGGNDLSKISKKKHDKIRDSINNIFLRYAINNNVKLIGVCAGAQFIANRFRTKIVKLKNHVGTHKISFTKNIIKKTPNIKKTNSFHNYGIKKISTQLNPLGFADDNTIELFVHNKYKILGIMWHPERFKRFRTFDKKIFLENLWN